MMITGSSWLSESSVLPTDGPSFPFIASEIDTAIACDSPGVYVLGYEDEDGRFVVQSVGRADQNLKDELSLQLTLLRTAGCMVGPEGKHELSCRRFKFSYAATADETFAQECLIFHAALESGRPLLNRKHPTRDAGQVTLTERGGGPRARGFCPIWQCAWNY